MRRVLLHLPLLTVPLACAEAPAARDDGNPRRIIDMHLHALPVDGFPADWDDDWTGYSRPPDDETVMRLTLEALERFGVERAVTSGSPELVTAYRSAHPHRIVPSLIIGAGSTPESLRRLADSLGPWYEADRFEVIGEVATQYAGIPPSDPLLAPVFAFAEREGVPVGIHMGTGPPDLEAVAPDYRVGLGNPLELEEVLVRHPDLSIYVMHAGYPYLDAMLAILRMYPQVHAELSMINWIYPREEFHRYLRTLVEAGFEDRLLFGSDQMLWPDAYEEAVAAIDSAGFLTADQKDAIFYRNAARFLGVGGGG